MIFAALQQTEVYGLPKVCQSTNVGILPRTPEGTEDLLDAHALDAAVKRVPINRIPVPQQVLRGAIPREGFDDLLSRPVRRGFSVTLKWTTRRLSCASTSSTKRTLKPKVGTVKKSMDTSSLT